MSLPTSVCKTVLTLGLCPGDTTLGELDLAVDIENNLAVMAEVSQSVGVAVEVSPGVAVEVEIE